MDIPVTADMESKGEGSVVNQQSAKQTRCLVVSSSLILGASAGVPYFSPARDAAGNNVVLGYFCGASTLIVFGISSTWGWHHILKELIERHRNSEGQITTKTILSIIFAFFLAICSGAILPFELLALSTFALDVFGSQEIINESS